MTSAVGGGGGSPKSRGKEQNELICDSDRGRGTKNLKFLRISYMEAQLQTSVSVLFLLQFFLFKRHKINRKKHTVIGYEGVTVVH